MYRVIVFLSILLLAGCYSYAPARTEALSAGTEVRAHLTGAGSDRLLDVNGLDTRRLEGEVLDVGEDRIVLSVPVPADPGSPRYRGLEERVILPLADLAELEIREMDRTRTGLFAGGAVVVAGSILRAALRGESKSEEGTGPPPPNEFRRIPLIRITW